MRNGEIEGQERPHPVAFRKGRISGNSGITGFIREEAVVALDTNGSRLEFLTAKDDRLSWKLIWVYSATSHLSLAMDKDGFLQRQRVVRLH